jgi:membrane protein YdbS with pleckstrin-like domain
MDTNKIDFKKIWDVQKDNNMDLSQLRKKIERMQRLNTIKNLLTSLLLLLTILIIGYIAYLFYPQLIIPKIGLLLILLSIIFLIIILNKNLFPFLSNRIIQEKSNKDYLKFLLYFKEKQKFIQTRILNYYFITLFMGVLFFMYEFVNQIKLIWFVIAYTITILWIMAVYLIIRPRIINKQNNAIDEIIKKAKAIKYQLDNNN